MRPDGGMPTTIGPTYRLLLLPSAPKRCHYIKYLLMALLQGDCIRSFLALLSLNSDLIKGLLVYSYLPIWITFI